MTDYLFSLFGLCALLGALSLIHYNPDGAERRASRVLFAAALVLPLIDAVISLGSLSLPSIPDTEGGEYIEVAEAAFSDGIARAVAERFSIPRDSISVVPTGFDFRRMRAEKIKITLSGIAALADGRAIREFIEGCGLGECEVKIRVG